MFTTKGNYVIHSFASQIMTTIHNYVTLPLLIIDLKTKINKLIYLDIKAKDIYMEPQNEPKQSNNFLINRVTYMYLYMYIYM